MEKFKRVTIKTPKGERQLEFEKVSGEIEEDRHVCNLHCPYGRSCLKLRDPRDPDNPDKNFNAFCAELGKEGSESDDPELCSMIPQAGTIERNLSDFPDVFQQLIKADPQVKLSDIIDKFCSGWCDMYNEERSNCCNSGNKMCLMNSLFMGPADFVKVDEPYDPDIEMLEELDRQRKEEEEKENAKD